MCFYGRNVLSFGILDMGSQDSVAFLDRPLAGKGIDAHGEFVVSGRCDRNIVFFTKQYTSNENVIEKHTNTWRFEGVLDTDMERITGIYANMDFLEHDNVDKPGRLIGRGAKLGSFVIFRRPTYYFRPWAHLQFGNESRQRWHYAIHSVLHAVRVRARHTPWEFFQDRRARRSRFVELYNRYDETNKWGSLSFPEPLSYRERLEFAQLQNTTSRSDFIIYLSVANHLSRGEAIHS